MWLISESARLLETLPVLLGHVVSDLQCPSGASIERLFDAKDCAATELLVHLTLDGQLMSHIGKELVVTHVTVLQRGPIQCRTHA